MEKLQQRAQAGAEASPAPSAAESRAVALRDVRKVYGRRAAAVTALDGVTLDIDRGTFVAVMGPSGSGKSTLLQCAAGLDRPSAGEVFLDGVDLRRLSENELTVLRRERIGFVFQSFNLVPALSAELNVALPLRLAGRRPRRREVRDVLAAVGLAGRGRHRPAELSGGQQQRVAIARALVTRPAVLFADEPTGALDTRTGREVLTLLRELVDVDGQTIVMVTHDPVAASYADRVVFLVDGRAAGELLGPDPATVAARLAGLEPDGREYDHEDHEDHDGPSAWRPAARASARPATRASGPLPAPAALGEES
ncbi:ABC transporter ATP-binding protein [Pseudofrankia sp. BMG5.37]|uniref:ABC transporter ATP-binding protein n=1 Tax=Pseudofrankia sp. BMG5.37 TaxID=3050035 RepID=UPI002893E1EE|nr:ABC transporter ATP-binding protein [Pseudofrankia sp. BMG5.37]MDT3438936.1 ABC transporter ATP-binding protein [Pseudofrankia sp. BMG5.37]